MSARPAPGRLAMRAGGSLLLWPIVSAFLPLAVPAALSQASSHPPASRIVSTAPNFTEILFALGAGEQLAAVSDYCRYPDEARLKPRIGGPFNLNYERIVALRADLVVLPRSLGGAAEKCRILGLPVLQLPNEKVDEVLQSIARLGEASGRRAEASRLAEDIRSELEASERATSGLAPVPTLIVVLRAPGSLQDLTAASQDTFLDELLRRAGGENVIKNSISRYPRVSKEEIINLDPEVILDLTFTTAEEDFPSIWAQLPTLKAVRAGRVVALPDPSMTIPGPGMAQTLRRFRSILHPERN